MKITDAEVIKNGEKDLIDAITADLDWGAIENIFLKEHNLNIEEDISYRSGDIVAVENQIAYKLEFDVKVKLSIMLDRDGNYISIAINKNKFSQPSEGEVTPENPEDNEHEKMFKESPGEIQEPSYAASGDDFQEMESRVDDILESINKETSSE